MGLNNPPVDVSFFDSASFVISYLVDGNSKEALGLANANPMYIVNRG
jgi:hypothetical protein